VNKRVILDVFDATQDTPEGDLAVDSARDLVGLLPGTQAMLYDGAGGHGKNNRAIYGIGILPVTRMTKAPGGRPKEHPFGPVRVHKADGTKGSIQVHFLGGAPHAMEILDDGSIELVLLPRVTTKPEGRCGEARRWYNEHTVPEELGGGIIRIRVSGTKADEMNGFNREELIRAIPESDPDWQRLYGRRNDAESGNRVLDDSMRRERAHSVGRPGIYADLLAWAGFQNAQTRALYGRRRVGPSPEALMAA
jgi:hypothetical protein